MWTWAFGHWSWSDCLKELMPPTWKEKNNHVVTKNLFSSLGGSHGIPRQLVASGPHRRCIPGWAGRYLWMWHSVKFLMGHLWCLSFPDTSVLSPPPTSLPLIWNIFKHLELRAGLALVLFFFFLEMPSWFFFPPILIKGNSVEDLLFVGPYVQYFTEWNFFMGIISFNSQNNCGSLITRAIVIPIHKWGTHISERLLCLTNVTRSLTAEPRVLTPCCCLAGSKIPIK